MASRSKDREEISRRVARIQAGALALVCGLIGGLSLFAMTVWLLIKGGPQVGLHLQLLENYFPGYSVTWIGSFTGFLYGVLTGGLIGCVVGAIYNKIVRLRVE
jgi:hypothetical protein